MKLIAAVRVFSACSVAVLLLTVAVSGQDVSAPINWKAPPVWRLDSKPTQGSPSSGRFSVTAVPTALLPFVGIPPCRLADTRGNGFTGEYGPPAVTGAGRTMTVVGQCGIPAGAQAVSFNFTAANISAAGFLVTYPAGGAFPPVATMAYNQNTPNLSNAAVVPLGSGGAITIVAGVTNVDVIVDVNGYYGPDLDSVCVNEGQGNSITSSMIVDGTIVNADINASAAIADTKLATIATAGKVADTALSSNVTKLGQTIDASEIDDVLRSVSIPLTSFIDCQSDTHAFLDFSSGADRIADLTSNPEDGAGTTILFDNDPGNEDQDSEICGNLMVPEDYASGGNFIVRVHRATSPSGVDEFLTCGASVNFGPLQAPGTNLLEIGPGDTPWFCGPTIASLEPEDSLSFYLSITSPGTMDNPLRILAVHFRYFASQ